MLLIGRRHAILGMSAAFAGASRIGHAQDSKRPLRIGLIGDLSGPYSATGGIGCVIGAKLAAEDVGNQIGGRPIEILSADHMNKPDIASNIAREWIDAKGVEVIADGGSSSCGLAILQVTRERQKIYLVSGPTSSDFTGKLCSPLAPQFQVDTYALANGTVQSLLKQGGKTWFFLSVDYTFGHDMVLQATRFIERAGGKVLGSAKHPLGSSDFSSQLLQAQSSGAQVIAFANAGVDTQNAIKQAAEFGITNGGQRLAALLMFISDVASIGKELAGGLVLTTSFDWNLNDETRAWTKRFRAQKNSLPTMEHAAAYSAARHYLKAVQASGSSNAPDVAAKMRELPVNDMINHDVRIREDNRVLSTVYVVQVKRPKEAQSEDDYYKVLEAIPGSEAFRPVSEGGCSMVRT